jgi:5'-nucleotidase
VSDPLELTLIHTNDVHSRFRQVNAKGVPCTETEATKGLCFGGFARLYHKVPRPHSIFGSEFI